MITTTTTIHPTCFQLLSSSLPVCQRKKRQYIWEYDSNIRTSPFWAKAVQFNVLPHLYAEQYIRPNELFENEELLPYQQYEAIEHPANEDSNLIESSIKTPATAEGRFFLTKTIVSPLIRIATVTETAGITMTNILACYPLSGVSGPLCNPSVYPEEPEGSGEEPEL
ncbi:uncharacterized protein LOC136043681 isoform X2 [Artemia franciscana]